MTISSKKVRTLLDYLLGPASNSERVRQFWYSPGDAIREADDALALGLSGEEIGSIAIVITEGIRLATEQSVLQQKRSEQRIERSIRSMKSSFRVQIVMHNVMFYLGATLVVASMVFAFLGKWPAALSIGGIGVFDLAIFFLKEPIEGVHESAGNLLQLRAAYNAFFAQLSQWQLYFDNLDKPQFVETKRQITKLIRHSTQQTIQLIHDYTGTEELDESGITRFFKRLRGGKKPPNDSEDAG